MATITLISRALDALSDKTPDMRCAVYARAPRRPHGAAAIARSAAPGRRRSRASGSPSMRPSTVSRRIRARRGSFGAEPTARRHEGAPRPHGGAFPEDGTARPSRTTAAAAPSARASTRCRAPGPTRARPHDGAGRVIVAVVALSGIAAWLLRVQPPSWISRRQMPRRREASRRRRPSASPTRPARRGPGRRRAGARRARRAPTCRWRSAPSSTRRRGRAAEPEGLGRARRVARRRPQHRSGPAARDGRARQCRDPRRRPVARLVAAAQRRPALPASHIIELTCRLARRSRPLVVRDVGLLQFKGEEACAAPRSPPAGARQGQRLPDRASRTCPATSSATRTSSCAQLVDLPGALSPPASAPSFLSRKASPRPGAERRLPPMASPAALDLSLPLAGRADSAARPSGGGAGCRSATASGGASMTTALHSDVALYAVAPHPARLRPSRPSPPGEGKSPLRRHLRARASRAARFSRTASWISSKA